ncbi:hypothetical protein L209DRAFT_587436 [Thermothelomyces heterothallicus CBS 203.75]
MQSITFFTGSRLFHSIESRYHITVSPCQPCFSWHQSTAFVGGQVTARWAERPRKHPVAYRYAALHKIVDVRSGRVCAGPCQSAIRNALQRITRSSVPVLAEVAFGAPNLDPQIHPPRLSINGTLRHASHVLQREPTGARGRVSGSTLALETALFFSLALHEGV